MSDLTTDAPAPAAGRGPDTRAMYELFIQESNGGGPPTEAELAAWAEHQREAEAEERRESLLGIVDLEKVAKEGTPVPEMLVEDLIVAGEPHLVFGPKETAKTWVLLHAAREIVRDGGRVLWVDQEMGRAAIVGRLIALGMTPEEMGPGRFLYSEFASLDGQRDSRVAWRDLLRHRAPDLVVVDAQTEVLASAGLNENVGTDVARWAAAYTLPALRAGAAVAMIDHTGHTEQGRSVGSRHKGAGVRVELKVEREEPFDRDSTGRVKVSVEKNANAAPIPGVQRFRLGGDGDGGFVFERTSADADPKSSERARRRHELAARIEATVREHGPLTQSQVADMVAGKKTEVIAAARELATGELSRVNNRPGPNRSIEYFIEETKSDMEDRS